MDNNNNNDTTQLWTATRCHRLLRPLLTHIGALRKELARHPLASQADIPSQSAKGPDQAGGKRPRSQAPSDGPSKRARRTYSNKVRRRGRPPKASSTTAPDVRAQAQESTRPATQTQGSRSGDMVLSTPFLRRVRNYQPSPPPETAPEEPEDYEPVSFRGRCCCHPSSGCEKSRCSFETELAGLRAEMDPLRHNLYEAIFRALESLLRATMTPPKAKTAAAKSLLGLCLRRVPDYIAELQYWERKDAEETGSNATLSDSRVSFDIYTELESLGGGVGWRHLRAVVRAHGLKILAGAISDDLLDITFSNLLVRFVSQFMPLHECEPLVDALVLRPYPDPSKSQYDIFREPEEPEPLLAPLWVLYLPSHAGLSALLPRKLNTLLELQLLPWTWLVTRGFALPWASMAVKLAQKKSSLDAIEFIITSIKILSINLLPYHQRPRTDGIYPIEVRNTLSIFLTALATMVLAYQGEASSLPYNTDKTSTSKNTRVCRRIEYIIQSHLAESASHGRGKRQLGRYMLSLCAFLSLQADYAPGMIKDAWARAGTQGKNAAWKLQYEATARLIVLIARSHSCGTSIPPMAYLSKLCDQIDALQLPGDPLKNIRVVSAFQLADETGVLKDLVAAESLVAGNWTPSSSRGQALAKTAFAGFRWDEGISEWVTVEPVPKNVLPGVEQLLSDWDLPEKARRRSSRRFQEGSLGGNPEKQVLTTKSRRISQAYDELSGDELGQENLIQPSHAKAGQQPARVARKPSRSSLRSLPQPKVMMDRGDPDWGSEDELGL